MQKINDIILENSLIKGDFIQKIKLDMEQKQL